MQQDLAAAGGEAPGGHHRLAPLARPDALGNAVDEEIDDLVFTEVEFLVVAPELLAEFGDGGAREQQPAVVGAEGILDVAHRQAAGQHLHRKLFQRLGPPLRVIPDLGPEGFVAPGDLGRGELDRALRRLEPTGPMPVPVELPNQEDQNG